MKQYFFLGLIILMIISMQIWQAFSKHPFQFFPHTETNHYHPYYKPRENGSVSFPSVEESKKNMKEDYKYQIIFFVAWAIVLSFAYYFCIVKK